MKTHPFLKRIARLATWLIAGIFVLAVAGAVYQLIATQSDKTNYPAPGQLLDVGGYRLHISCTGQGSPTVILEAAADMMSADWGWIQPEIAKKSRRSSARAGGGSECVCFNSSALGDAAGFD